MGFDDWLKAGNGARKDETLEDAIGRTVGKTYDTASISCPSCGTRDINGKFHEAFNGLCVAV